MKIKQRLTFFFLIIGAPFLSFSQSVPSASPFLHDPNVKITALAYNLPKGILVSGAEDGSLLIRNIEDNTLHSTLQLEAFPIEEIALNSQNDSCAVLQNTGDTYLLSVWNVKTQSRQYRYRLLTRPLFVNFSPSGNYLLYGNMQINSLTLIHTLTGKKMPWLASIHSIIQAQTMNPADTVLLAYLTSGEIITFQVQTGKIIRRIQTLPNLENPQFAVEGNIILLIGTLRDTLSVINANDGRQLNSVQAPGIIKAVPSLPLGRIVYASFQDGYTFLFHWNFLKKNAKPKNVSINRDFSDTGAFVYYEDRILCGLSDGSLIAFDPESGRSQPIAAHRLHRFTGFFLTETTLTLASDSAFYQADLKPLLRGGTSFRRFANPLRQATRVLPFDSDRFLAYNTEGETGTLLLVAADGSKTEAVYQTENKAVKNLKRTPTGFLGLTQNGYSFMLNPTTFQSVFQYRAGGTNDNEIVNRNRLLTARTRDPFFHTPLIFIDATTQETVPLPADDFLTFDLSFTPDLATLYTLGIENRGDRVRTVLKAYRGQNFEICQPLFSVSGEHHDAALLYDPYTSNLYTTLGGRGIRLLQWGGMTAHQWSGHTPLSLGVNSKLLAALNHDGTFTLWNKASGKERLTLYLFPDQIVNDVK